jgi:hypothetical protein
MTESLTPKGLDHDGIPRSIPRRAEDRIVAANGIADPSASGRGKLRMHRSNRRTPPDDIPRVLSARFPGALEDGFALCGGCLDRLAYDAIRYSANTTTLLNEGEEYENR